MIDKTPLYAISFKISNTFVPVAIVDREETAEAYCLRWLEAVRPDTEIHKDEQHFWYADDGPGVLATAFYNTIYLNNATLIQALVYSAEHTRKVVKNG